MKKIYRVKILFIDEKERFETVLAEDELEAIDLVVKKYNTKDIVDIKVI